MNQFCPFLPSIWEDDLVIETVNMLFSKRMIVLIRPILQDIDIRYKMSIVRLVINIDGVAYVEFLYTFFSSVGFRRVPCALLYGGLTRLHGVMSNTLNELLGVANPHESNSTSDNNSSNNSNNNNNNNNNRSQAQMWVHFNSSW